MRVHVPALSLQAIPFVTSSRYNDRKTSFKWNSFFTAQPRQNTEQYQLSKSSCSIENQVNIKFNQSFNSLLFFSQNYIIKVNEKGVITSIQVKSVNKEIEFQQAFAQYTSIHFSSERLFRVNYMYIHRFLCRCSLTSIKWIVCFSSSWCRSTKTCSY